MAIGIIRPETPAHHGPRRRHERGRWQAPAVRRGRWTAFALAIGIGAGLAAGLAACRLAEEVPPPSTRPGVSATGSVLTDVMPDGFALETVSNEPPADLSALMIGRTEPLSVTVATFSSQQAGAPATASVPAAEAGAPTLDGGGTITVTLAVFPDAVGATALYNRWFAEYGFIPAAERRTLPFGDQGECFDAGYPVFHKVIVRDDTLFALLEADRTVPMDRCAAMLETLVAEWPR